MEIKAYAKINLSLDVVSKREDNYHLLKMIMQSIELYDLIKIDKAKEGINIKSNLSYIPTDNKNIAYKAAKIFYETFKVEGGVDINIEKHIPVAAGLAGGSTDGAAVLRGLCRLYNIHMNKKEMESLGVKVGADVPFCIKGGTALCEGIGEIITPLKPFRDVIILLVKPNFGVSTKEVFKNIDLNMIFKHPDTEKIINSMNHRKLKDFSIYSKNVLENVTLKKYPVLRSIKLRLLNDGAVFSMMSGSGPTVFGVFDDMQKALLSYESFKKQYKETYLTRTI